MEYHGDVSTATAGLERTKILFNSIISTPGAKFTMMDISNMDLKMPSKTSDTCASISISSQKKS